MRPMWLWKNLALKLGLTLFAATAYAGMLNYQGRVSIDGTNFSGQGCFVFSLHDTNGTILWASGELPFAGTTNLPRAVWRLPARDGVYNIRLGDTSIGMPALDLSRVLSAPNPFLRVWFTDGSRGWQAAAGDTPLNAALTPPSPETAAGNAGLVLSGSQAEAILKELRELRALVQKLPTAGAPVASALDKPQIVTVPLGGSPVLGAVDAPLVLVEFTDYECPDCYRAHEGVLAELKKKYVETGKLRFVSRNLPLPSHPNAEPAAHAALCAMQQNQFWSMHDKLYALRTRLTRTSFLQAASELNLDTELFRACLDGRAFATQIGRDRMDAERLGISATPTFVLGRRTGDGVTGLMMIGVRSLPQFEAEIEKQLAGK